MFKDKLKQLRIAHNFTQTQLANELGVADSTISNWERGDRTPDNIELLSKIARLLHTTSDYLIGTYDTFNTDTTNITYVADATAEPTIVLPLLGFVSAGYGSYADITNGAEEFYGVPKSWIKGTHDYVLLRVTGDSMTPKFEENDILLVRCQPTIENGQYGIILIDDENGVVKRIHKSNDKSIELQSINPMYAPRRFEGEDMNRLTVFGIVQKSVRDYK